MRLSSTSVIPALTRTSRFIKGLTRLGVAQAGRIVFHGDLVRAKALSRAYFVPPQITDELDEAVQRSPFVYERPDAPHLVRFRTAFDLDSVIAGISDEYEAMLGLGTWLGAQWDHGVSPIPGGRAALDLVGVVEAGRKGAGFWCEIAALVGVQAFAAMGWPARLITASRDGLTWEHAVTEAWSNRFAKWFVLDLDFNVVFESDGVPLSAYELCHGGPALQSAGALTVRKLGPPKATLPLIDLIPYFIYVHLELRSDWYTRRLPPGSPAGGDRSTWWTSRPEFRPPLTPKIRVDDELRFNWPVNIVTVELDPIEPTADRHGLVRGRLSTYSPYFVRFESSVDGGPWTGMANERIELALDQGDHVLSMRVRVSNGGVGPATRHAIHVPRIGTRTTPAISAAI